MGIRENIVKLRKQHGLTQEELAKIAGVSRGAVSQWEGGFSEPRMGAIQRMADYFKVKKSDLIEDSPDAPLSPDERELLGCYRSCTPERQDALLNLARDSALLSGPAAERGAVSEVV